MRFSGDMDDVCAITFTPVREISRPVGFDTAHAFECESIVEWITKKRSTNPVTGLVVSNTAVACLLHPLIVDENAEHVAETQVILNGAGWVKGAQLCSAMSVMRVHIVIYTIYALLTTKLLSDSGVAAAVSVFIIISSFVQLMHQTCHMYPVNGKWIMGYFCVIGVIVFTLIELGSPNTRMMAKFFVSHGSMLTARFIFDTNKLYWMDMQ
jgi:hypothetical protein